MSLDLDLHLHAVDRLSGNQVSLSGRISVQGTRINRKDCWFTHREHDRLCLVETLLVKLRLSLLIQVQLALPDLDKLKVPRDAGQDDAHFQVGELGSGAPTRSSLVGSEAAVWDLGALLAEPPLGHEVVLGLAKDLGVALDDVGSRGYAEVVDDQLLSVGEGQGGSGSLGRDAGGCSGRVQAQGFLDHCVGVCMAVS